MKLSEGNGASFRFSAGELPPSRRLPALRDVFEQIVHLDLQARDDQAVEADMVVHAGPGLRRTRVVSKLAAHLQRPARLLSDGDDALCLVVKTGGRLALAQRGNETVAQVGDGVVFLYREPASFRFIDAAYFAVRVPVASLAGLAGDIGATAGRYIPRQTQALGLLRAYLATLPADIRDAHLQRVVATHVCDLMALAIGATGEGRQRASERSLRAVRLQAIKADLAQDAGLSLDQLSARHGISPRYVQLLFEAAGTTFSRFVLERRLEATRAMLASPRYDRWSIAAIALEAGFGDLSYFNRTFKRRYGMRPSDVRGEAPSYETGSA